MILDERDVEGYLTAKVEAAGGQCIKLGQDGWPDRIVVLPHGRIVWCELKQPHGKPAALQLYRKKILERLGCIVYLCYTKKEADAMLGEISSAASSHDK
jgi:hypothetical protein